MGRRRQRGRNVSGILLLDKPVGESSNKSLQRVRAIYNAAKAGHTGNLDPLASGLLPVCLGEATKVSAFLLDADKRYWTECQLGEVTNTGDREGEVIQRRPVPSLDEDQVKAVLQAFIGEQEQLPPMFSAIKQNGKALYELARKGIEVERKSRRITVHDIQLLGLEKDRLILNIHCSKGTYVRSLVEDIGEELGCGAHVSALRRLAVADFDIQAAHDFDELQHLRDAKAFQQLDDLLVPMEAALSNFPEVILNEDAAFYLKQGQPVLIPKAPTEGLVRLTEMDVGFIGVGQILEDGRVAPKRMLSTA